MSLSDYINLSLSVLSLLLAIISVITVILTLKQNSKMIESATRAYISVYGDSINNNSIKFYIVIKNFGQSSAKITSFECDTDLVLFSFKNDRIPFLHMQGTSMAPNQAYKCNLQHTLLFNSGIEQINFKISYECNNKIYNDTFCIILKSFSDLIRTRDNVKNKELQAIYNALEELDERLL